MIRIAAFDCDGTLIRGDATRYFLLECRGFWGVSADLLFLMPQLFAWCIGKISTAAFKQAMLDRCLQATTINRRKAALDSLAVFLVEQLRPEALVRLRQHQRHGDHCLIVSASPEPLIASLADHLGIELIATGCTDPLLIGPTLPFRLTTPNCKGPEKLRRLEQHLGALPPPELLEAYGDSVGDRELLQASGSPHWRSFAEKPEPYRHPERGRWLVPFFAVIFLTVALSGFARLDQMHLILLLTSLKRLLLWLPALYSLLALSYLGRYVRWRILLGSCGVGQRSWSDLYCWFLGFALTATPGKLGELSRVQQLHATLGYPRLPLLHAFAAERLCDAAAVALWLIFLMPRSLPLPTLRALIPFVLLFVLVVVVVVSWLWRPIVLRCRQWRHHFPRGAMLIACAPALFASFLFWGCEGLLLWLLMIALSPTSISALSAIAIYLLSGTVGMASSLPGGIGVNEATTVLLLSQQGIPVSVSLPVAVLRRLITPWSIVALATSLAFFTVPRRADLQ